MSKTKEERRDRFWKKIMQNVQHGLAESLGTSKKCFYEDKRGACVLNEHRGDHEFGGKK